MNFSIFPLVHPPDCCYFFRAPEANQKENIDLHRFYHLENNLIINMLVGGLEHEFDDFPYVGNSNPN